MARKVFVSGAFDLFHSGHIAFLKKASEFGEVYVSVASDNNIEYLKNKKPIYNERERLTIIQSLKLVKEAFIADGVGRLDFVNKLMEIRPDIFVVNEDGNIKEKRALCKGLGIKYVVLKRAPLRGLPKRSSTEIRGPFNNFYSENGFGKNLIS